MNAYFYIFMYMCMYDAKSENTKKSVSQKCLLRVFFSENRAIKMH